MISLIIDKKIEVFENTLDTTKKFKVLIMVIPNRSFVGKNDLMQCLNLTDKFLKLPFYNKSVSLIVFFFLLCLLEKGTEKLYHYICLF